VCGGTTWKRLAANGVRRTVYGAARFTGVQSPFTLNLQAYGRMAGP
jgi:hypothetical protein